MQTISFIPEEKFIEATCRDRTEGEKEKQEECKRRLIYKT